MKGGVDPMIRREDFKYTMNPERIIWTTNAYNIGLHLLDVVKQIPWDKYTFNDRSSVWKPNENEEFSLVEEHVKASYVQLSKKFIPYCLFGGSCYEIINNVHKLNLYDFVDPTGDIDVKFNLPFYEIDTRSEINHSYIFTTPDRSELLPHINHLTTWILTQIEQLVQQKPAEHMNYNTIPCTQEEVLFTSEGKVDIVKQLGNLWLLRSIGERLLKIQLVCKFEGMQHPDHIMEYVFQFADKVTNMEDPTGIRYRNTTNKAGFSIQTNEQLIQDNISAMQQRETLYKTEDQHKWFNHVQRMKFLNHNMDTLRIDVTNPTNIHNLSELFMYVISRRRNLCIFSYIIPRRELGNCYAKQALIHLFGKFLFIFNKNKKILDTVLIKRTEQKFKTNYQTVFNLVHKINELISMTNYGGRKTKKFKKVE